MSQRYSFFEKYRFPRLVFQNNICAFSILTDSNYSNFSFFLEMINVKFDISVSSQFNRFLIQASITLSCHTHHLICLSYTSGSSVYVGFCIGIECTITRCAVKFWTWRKVPNPKVIMLCPTFVACRLLGRWSLLLEVCCHLLQISYYVLSMS